jgi:hypothetical protein
MALGSTQPLTEVSTRSIFWEYRRPVRQADNLTTILCRCQEIWEPQLPGNLWTTPGLYLYCFTFSMDNPTIRITGFRFTEGLL